MGCLWLWLLALLCLLVVVSVNSVVDCDSCMRACPVYLFWMWFDLIWFLVCCCCLLVGLWLLWVVGFVARFVHGL